MGWGYNGMCYETCAKAQNAFGMSFPYHDVNYLANLSEQLQVYSTANTCGATARIYGRWMSDYTATVRVHSVSFWTCNVDQASTFDPIQAGAMWGLVFTSTLVLWLVAKNLGLILKAIRFW